MNILHAAVVLSVGFGLGVAYALVGGVAPDVTDRPAEAQRAEMSSAVSAATWTDGPWPFTVGQGTLRCIGPAGDPGVFFATDAGETFALNPAAIRMAGRVGAAADLDPIWRWTDRDLPNVKVNVSPMILYALALC